MVKHTYLNTSLKNTHYLRLDLEGGLGKIMFQYASLYGISKHNAMIPVIDKGDYLGSIFPALKAFMMEEIESIYHWEHFRERAPNSYDNRARSLNFAKNIELQGFYQSWRYFHHVKEDLRTQFSFHPNTVQIAEGFLKEAYNVHSEKFPRAKSNVRFIGLHVRRGDYLDPHNTDKGYTTASLKYIKRAMHYFGARFKHIIFVVTSDDKRWARYNIKSHRHLVIISPHESASYDLCILSLCNHTITTVGAFSWWAAFLARGEAVYYKGFPSKHSSLSYMFSSKDYYLPHWVGL